MKWDWQLFWLVVLACSGGSLIYDVFFKSWAVELGVGLHVMFCKRCKEELERRKLFAALRDAERRYSEYSYSDERRYPEA